MTIVILIKDGKPSTVLDEEFSTWKWDSLLEAQEWVCSCRRQDVKDADEIILFDCGTLEMEIM